MRIATAIAKRQVIRRPARTSKTTTSKVFQSEAIERANAATVLVVDDDAYFLRSMKRLVAACGFHVETFGRPSELIASATPSSNACMVVDIDMPEMTGIEMCELLKANGRGLPTILITGRTDARTRASAEQTDAVAVLLKPFDEASLLDAIGRAVRLSKRTR